MDKVDYVNLIIDLKEKKINYKKDDINSTVAIQLNGYLYLMVTIIADKEIDKSDGFSFNFSKKQEVPIFNAIISVIFEGQKPQGIYNEKLGYESNSGRMSRSRGKFFKSNEELYEEIDRLIKYFNK